MPKYCIRADGAVYPYSEALARRSEFKIVDELPEDHVRAIERSKGRADHNLVAARAMRDAQDLRMAGRRDAADAVRARVAKGPNVDSAAAAEAQRQADEFAGKGSNAATDPANPAAPAAAATPAAPVVEQNDPPQNFVIGTADKPALLEFLKANFPAEKVHHNIGVEKLRLKVAELAGVKSE